MTAVAEANRMRFLYVFGFESPDEAERNQRDGRDDESSCAVVIEADDPEQARAWGRRIAGEFFRNLHGDPAADWIDAGYADLLNEEDAADAQGLQVVAIGAHPDYARLLHRFE
jgi:hypothetical protein